MPKHKILEVLEATTGGTRRHISDLLLGLNTESIEPWFAYATERADSLFFEELRAIESRGIHTIEIPMTRGISPIRDAKSLWLLYQLMKQERFDLVHGHSSKAGFLARIAAKLANRHCMTVYTPHSMAVNVSSVYMYLEKVAGIFTDAIVAVSESECSELKSYNLPVDHIVTIYNGVRVRPCVVEKTEVRRRWDIPDSAVVIGTCARVSPQKDPATFLEAAEVVLKQIPNALFLWIGCGEMLDWARAEVRHLGIADHIRFQGYQSEVMELLSALDIFVLTSVYESFGYATAEAMAMALPVIATDTAGSRDLVVPGRTGVLVPPRHPRALANAIVNLALDVDEQSRMGLNGKKRILEKFSCREMIKATEALYRSLLASRCTLQVPSPRQSNTHCLLLRDEVVHKDSLGD